jgi:hypothetical protein
MHRLISGRHTAVGDWLFCHSTAFSAKDTAAIQPGSVGNPALQNREAFPNQRRGYFRARHRSQVKLFEFIDLVPRAIPDAYYFADQVGGRSIDHAYPALPDHLETDCHWFC